MTILVRHRVNSLAQLLEIPLSQGVEIDVRSRSEQLILHHDPFSDGELFADWLSEFQHQLLIVNIKEEGLETAIFALLREYAISNFFLLDQSFPFLVRTITNGERRTAVRVSEYESPETALSLSGSVDWVWVDTMTRMPLNRETAHTLRSAGFQLCLASPELHGHKPELAIARVRDQSESVGISFDAVCTKRPDLWLG